ncbi:hypothetical protein DSO57_1039793 [Entomophthora muscae]|uniref:Uncharacterized protein n=1 Tax=Entomophthora muscae TaxID=34485 RepID=A0ACC2SIH2_9FUNG|nr:hypothetical protein DSO57_1039793 [Entomophthora muscae]
MASTNHSFLSSYPCGPVFVEEEMSLPIPVASSAQPTPGSTFTASGSLSGRLHGSSYGQPGLSQWLPNCQQLSEIASSQSSMISWMNSIEKALTSLIPIQPDPMAEATGINRVSCSLEPALVKEVYCQYSPPPPSGCFPDRISLNSGTLQTVSRSVPCSGPPNLAQNISEAVHSHSGMTLLMSKIEHVLSSLVPTQMNQHVALEFYDHQQKTPKPEDIHNSCIMGFSALQDTIKAQERQMGFLEEELVLAFQEKKEWLDELDAQRSLFDSLQDQLSKHLEDASAISTPDTLMGLHGNAKADSSPSQKILTTLPLPDSHQVGHYISKNASQKTLS